MISRGIWDNLAPDRKLSATIMKGHVLYALSSRNGPRPSHRSPVSIEIHSAVPVAVPVAKHMVSGNVLGGFKTCSITWSTYIK